MGSSMIPWRGSIGGPHCDTAHAGGQQGGQCPSGSQGHN